MKYKKRNRKKTERRGKLDEIEGKEEKGKERKGKERRAALARHEERFDEIKESKGDIRTDLTRQKE